jgi:DNA-binding MarR family transcriptional regulator
VSLTPEGRKLMKKVFPAFNKQEQKVTQALSTAEKNKVAALLRAICQSCE